MKFLLKTIILLLIIPLLNGCGDPTEDIKIIVDTANIIDGDFAIQYLDANPETLIPPNDIKIEIVGKDAEDVIDLAGNKDFKVENGFITLALIPGTTASEEEPIEFSIISRAKGYLTSSTAITITDLESSNNIEIGMLNLNNPPKGVSVIETSLSISKTGEIVEEQVIETPKSNGVEEGAKIVFREGTVLLDESNKPIGGSGRVTATVTFFSSQEEAALFAFPGGFVANNLVDTDGTPLPPVQFTTAGLVDINLFAGNREVKNFSEPINVSIELNPNTLNPDLDYKQVASGDTIPVFSMERETDTWKYEGLSVVTQEDSKLKASFEVPHLSPWNWDWVWRSWWWRRYIATTCNSRARVSSNLDINSDVVRSYGSNYYYTELVDVNNNQVLRRSWRRMHNGENIWFGRVRRNTQVKMKVYKGYSWWNRGDLLAESAEFSSCDIGNINFQIPEQQIVQVDIKGVCSNNADIEIKPSTYIYYKSPNDRWWRFLGYLRQGKMATVGRIEVGETYSFATHYGGRWLTGNLSVEQSDNKVVIELPNQYCNSF